MTHAGTADTGDWMRVGIVTHCTVVTDGIDARRQWQYLMASVEPHIDGGASPASGRVA